MARHPYGPQARRRARNRTYTVLALVVVVLVIAFMYGPFGADAEDGSNPPEGSYPTDANTVAETPDANDNDTETFAVQDTEPVEPVPTEPVTVGPDPNTVAPDAVPEVQPVIAEPEPNLPAVAVQGEPGSTAEPNPEADLLIAEAAALIDQGTGGHLEARESLNQALRMPLSAKQKEYVKAQLSELSNRWLFSRTILPGDPLCETYLVRSGDMFETIGRKYKVPYEILMEINNIRSPRSLQAGQSLKVVNGPFHAKVYRSTFTMDLYLQNTYVRSFKVGLGKVETETPTGWWRVKPGGKLISPPWYDKYTNRTYHPEDPDYPLGSRWIALEGLSGEAKDRTGFAIHGTKEPEQIGAAGSRGCIRMHNGQAILVYNMLAEGLSQVEVID